MHINHITVVRTDHTVPLNTSTRMFSNMHKKHITALIRVIMMNTEMLCNIVKYHMTTYHVVYLNIVAKYTRCTDYNEYSTICAG